MAMKKPDSKKVLPRFTGYVVRVEVYASNGAFIRSMTFDMATPAERYFLDERKRSARPEVQGVVVHAVCVLDGKERVFTDAKTTTPRRFYKALNLAVQALR